MSDGIDARGWNGGDGMVGMIWCKYSTKIGL